MVCKPRAGLKLTMRRSVIGLLFVWTFCLFWAVTPLLGWSSYGPEGVQTSCSLAWEERSWNNYSYLILYTLLCFIFPVGVIIYCYCKVLTSMKKVGTADHSEQPSQPHPPPPSRSEQQKVRSPKICFVLIAEQECGAPGWAVLPEGERARHQHGLGHDNRLLCLLAALHSAVSGGCRGSRASHPPAGRHHAHVLCQDQSRLQPHHLLPFQQAGEQLCSAADARPAAAAATGANVNLVLVCSSAMPPWRCCRAAATSPTPPPASASTCAP